MGAWGYGALENDAALDAKYRWEDWVEKNGFEPTEATDRMFQYWGETINYGDTVTNSEIIAWLAIHVEKSLPIPKRLKKAAIDALNRELVPEELKEWSEPEARKNELMELLRLIGGKIKRPRKMDFFRHRAIHFKNSKMARDELVAMYEQNSYFSRDYYKPSKIPPFLKTLNRLMNSQVWEESSKISDQARTERAMMVLWYVAPLFDISKEQFAEFAKFIESKNG